MRAQILLMFYHIYTASNMSFSIKGTVESIQGTVQITDTFKKREFVIIVQDGEYKNPYAFQCVQDKVSLLDNYSIGQEIEVHFNIRCNKSKTDANRYFTGLTAWKIEGQQTTQPAHQSQPINAPAAQQATAPADVDALPF